MLCGFAPYSRRVFALAHVQRYFSEEVLDVFWVFPYTYSTSSGGSTYLARGCWGQGIGTLRTATAPSRIRSAAAAEAHGVVIVRKV